MPGVVNPVTGSSLRSPLKQQIAASFSNYNKFGYFPTTILVLLDLISVRVSNPIHRIKQSVNLPIPPPRPLLDSGP